MTVALQDDSPFVKPLVDVNPAGAFATSATTSANVFNIAAASSNNNANTGTLVPDIVGSIRIDQAWGGAQIAGLLRDDRATYYSNTFNGVISGSDHPSDKWGWSGMAGLELNLQNFLPWFGKGDSFAVQTQYCVGIVMTCSNNSGTRLADVGWSLINVNKIGLGWEDDGYFGSLTTHIAGAAPVGTGKTDLQLTTAWNVIGAIQHYWGPELRTSVYAGYLNYQANSSAVDTEVCQALNSGTFVANNATGNQVGQWHAGGQHRLYRLGGVDDRYPHPLESDQESRCRCGRALHSTGQNSVRGRSIRLLTGRWCSHPNTHRRRHPYLGRHHAHPVQLLAMIAIG